MNPLRLLVAAAVALGLAACGNKTTPDFAAGTPDSAGLTLETTGGSGDGLIASAPSGGASALSVNGSIDALTCQSYELTCNIRRSIAGVNLFIRGALEPVEALIVLGPVSEPSDDVRVYGPTPLPQGNPVANFRLSVKFMGNDTFRWKLEAQALMPPDAPFLVVMAGQLQRGDVPHRGRGFIGIDVDQLNAVNPTAFPGQGKLLAAFAHVGLQKALVYAAKQFQVAGMAAPVTAVFTGWKNSLGQARVRLAAINDFVAANGTAPANELLLSRIGYWPLLGGRTAVAVLGGNVPDYSVADFDVKAFVGLECFGTGIGVTYRAMFVCGTNTVQSVDECHPDATFNGSANAVGIDPLDPNDGPAAGACAAGTELYDASGLPTNPDSTAQEPDAPATPDAPPSAMPSF
ncbi:MAG TPA: hypothetical protein VIV57_10220 [Anaeromyxobacter sp.]